MAGTGSSSINGATVRELSKTLAVSEATVRVKISSC